MTTNHGLAVQLLVAAFRTKTPLAELPESARPRSFDDGYEIQGRLARALGYATCGWKIGLTTPASRKTAGVDAPMVGRLFREFAWKSGDTVEGVGHWVPGVETEFAFEIAKPPAPSSRPLTRAEAAATVGRCFLAFEIIGSRYVDKAKMGWNAILGDNAGGLGFVEGPDVPDWQKIDLPAVRCDVTADGAPLAASLTGEARSHPLDILAWFYEWAAARQVKLPAGVVISTGTTCVPVPIPLGKKIVGKFETLGEVSLTIAS